MSTLVIVNVVMDGSPERYSDNLDSNSVNRNFPGLREILEPLVKIHKIRELHLYLAGEIENKNNKEK